MEIKDPAPNPTAACVEAEEGRLQSPRLSVSCFWETVKGRSLVLPLVMDGRLEGYAVWDRS